MAGFLRPAWSAGPARNVLDTSNKFRKLFSESTYFLYYPLQI
jgi:hypothetical protein